MAASYSLKRYDSEAAQRRGVLHTTGRATLDRSR